MRGRTIAQKQAKRRAHKKPGHLQETPEQIFDLRVLKDFMKHFYPENQALRCEDFPIYGGRLLHIEEKMKGWRSRNLKELLKRPYDDPVAYYAFWFVIILGTFDLLGLVAGIIQAWASVRSIPDRS
jgi:hypothetical protein